MSVEQDIQDYEQIIASARTSLSLLKKRKKRQDDGKSSSDMTPRAFSKRNADIAWDNMELEQQFHQLHASAVDIGFAERRKIDEYDPVIFRPSAMHVYKFILPLPRCVQDWKNKKGAS